MGFLSWLVGEKSEGAGSPAPASQRPAWATAFSLSGKPILMCTQLTPENIYAESPRQLPTADAPTAAAASSAEGLLRPLAGADNTVPWPLPPFEGAQMLTFWGTGSARSAEFTLPSDGVLRIVARGPIEVRVRRKDGSYLSDRACLAAKQEQLAIMGIPSSGTYSLVVESHAEVDWGVTVLYMGPS
jgi:hypothetical protein